MKAEESVKNYPAAVRMYTNYTVREIKKICKAYGPRPAGYEAEKLAQEHIAEELKTCSDEVKIEPFKLAPKAFMSWVCVDGILIMISCLLNFFGLPYIGLALGLFAVVFMIGEFLLYKEFIDKLCPQKTSHNVYGVKKASGELKQRIIFSGHVDSSYEWTYTRLGGHVLLYICGVLAVVSLIFVLVSSILNTFGVLEEGTLFYNIFRYGQFIGIPGGILAICFVNFKVCVEGANDNLTGTVASVALLKYLKDNDINLEHTEVIALSAGAEESGLRGSKAFCKAHKEEYSDVPTAFIGLETFRDYDDIAIYQRDMTGTIKMDSRVCALMKKAGLDAGLDLPFSSVYMGASDAAAVQQAGIPAVTLAAMNPGPPKYYHTRGDTADNMDVKTVEKCLEIALNALFLFDENGLKEEY